MKKIVFLNIHSGFINRGVETLVKELAPRFIRDFQIAVYQGGKNKEQVNYLVKIINIGNINHNSGLANLIFTLKILPKLIKERPNIIYAFNGRWEAVFCRFLSFFIGAKLITGGHAGIGRDDLLNLLIWPDIYICLSAKGKKWADKYQPLVKKVIIPYGVDLNKFRPKLKQLKLSLQKPIVITVAGPESFKQVDLTIETMARLKGCSLLIIGKQSEKIIKLGNKLLGNRRFKVLALEHNIMPYVYNSAKVFTLASTSREAFGVAYLEAMSCNLPVVATNDSLRREIIGKAGILIDPYQINQYANALRTALNKNWGDIPRKQASKFSWDKVIERYKQIFIRINK